MGGLVLGLPCSIINGNCNPLSRAPDVAVAPVLSRYALNGINARRMAKSSSKNIQ